MSRVEASSPPTSSLPFALRLEACLWLMRESYFAIAVFVPAAWLAATDAVGWQLAVGALGVALLSGAGVALNDVMDRDGDAITAPYLPIPAGLVSVGAARLTVAGLGSSATALMAVAATSGRALVAPAFAFVFLGLLVVYSQVKHRPWAAAAAHGVLLATVVLAAWGLAGGDLETWPLVPLASMALGFGVAGNLIAGLRDIDADADAGNATLAMRLGAVRAHAWVAIIDAAVIVTVIFLAGTEDRLLAVAPFVAGAVGLRVTSLRALLESAGRAGHDRSRRLREMQSASLSRGLIPVAGVAVWSLPVACVCVVVLYGGVALLAPPYERRIVRGGLAARRARAAS